MVKIINNLVALAVIGIAFCGLASASTLSFDHYWTYDEIQTYLNELDAEFPQIGHIDVYGTTAEGRPLTAFCIHKEHAARAGLPVIFIEAGIRPREWIGVMASLYFLHEVVEHYYEFDALLDYFEIVVIPVANPDGYVYSHNVERLWNKNRRSVGSGCFGADINANFRYQFVYRDDPCAENYPGSSYFSEVESQQLVSFVTSVKYANRVSVYISLQSFGQQILLPYNYFNIASGNHAAALAIANSAATAIRTVNPSRVYNVGVGAALRGNSFGTSTDYAKGFLNVEYVYTFMLPSGGTSGFEVPEAEMPAIIAEAFAGLYAITSGIGGF
ncbi:unnamed protein product [Chironomus riparius]|uniref:Peptidase M14 domain-containing protein n=1 Tax=Chironomus riparius TaxID=315576 RepID=A0A9N9WM93_9DIPT|nr:unnamed protein product [Chironomus riparius]